jgi:hypothetical protein
MELYDIWRCGLIKDNIASIEAEDILEAFEYFAGDQQRRRTLLGQTWLVGPSDDENDAWWKAYAVVEDPDSSHYKHLIVVEVDER